MLNGGLAGMWQGAKNLVGGGFNTAKDTADLTASLVGTATSWAPLIASGAALGQACKFWKNSDSYKDKKKVKDAQISYDLAEKVRKKTK